MGPGDSSFIRIPIIIKKGAKTVKPKHEEITSKILFKVSHKRKLTMRASIVFFKPI